MNQATYAQDAAFPVTNSLVLAPAGQGRLSAEKAAALAVVKAKCIEEGDCWLWTPSVNSSGYPQARIGGALKMVRAYLLSEILGVEIPRGWFATTSCRNKRCCSPKCLLAMPRSAVVERSHACGARVSGDGYSARVNQIVSQGLTKLGFDGAEFVRKHDKGVSAASLGRSMGVDKSTVCRARKGLTWKTSMPHSSVFAWAMASS